MDLEQLERRLRAVEDIEAIKKLKAKYCAACDKQYDADAIAALFTEDAVWDGGNFGAHHGREAIRKFFQGASEIFPFALHQVMNPLIEVDGDSATGQWYLFQPCTLGEHNQAMWLAAKYAEEYVRSGEEWQFKSLKVNAEFFTPYEEGWAKKPFAEQ
jgi:ketosteroid isomerase-like protein